MFCYRSNQIIETNLIFFQLNLIYRIDIREDVKRLKDVLLALKLKVFPYLIIFAQTLLYSFVFEQLGTSRLFRHHGHPGLPSRC